MKSLLRTRRRLAASVCAAGIAIGSLTAVGPALADDPAPTPSQPTASPAPTLEPTATPTPTAPEATETPTESSTPTMEPEGFQMPRGLARSLGIADDVDRGDELVTNPAGAICSTGTVYSNDGTGNIVRIDYPADGSEPQQQPTGTGGLPSLRKRTVGGQINSLAIGQYGQTAYALELSRPAGPSVVNVFEYNAETDRWTSIPTDVQLGVGIVGGAVDPSTGKYYIGGFGEIDGIFQFRVFEWTGSTFVSRGWFPATANHTNANGDMAFDSQGNLFVAGHTRALPRRTAIYTVSANAFAGSTETTQLPGRNITPNTGLDGLSNLTGIAFDANGNIWASSFGTVWYGDPSTWTQDGRQGIFDYRGTFSSVDLASCSTPPTLELRKDFQSLPHEGDSVRLEILRSNGTLQAETDVQVTAPGVQKDSAGPALARPLQTFIIREVATSGTLNASRYDTGYECRATLEGKPYRWSVSGPLTSVNGGLQAEVTMPNQEGLVMVCTITNRARVSLQVNKIWSVNEGGATTAYPLNQAPAGFDVPLTVGGTSRAFGETLSNLRAGDPVTIAEGTPTLPQGCVVEENKITQVNGKAAGTERLGQAFPLPAGDTGALVTVTVTNSVRCDTALTLVKQIDSGSAAPSEFNLTATAGDGKVALNGRSGVSAPVSSLTRYALAESSVSNRAQNYVQTPGTGWDCRNDVTGAEVAITANELAVPMGARVTCTVRNSTAQIAVLKEMPSNVLTPEDFTLTLTPAADSAPGALPFNAAGVSADAIPGAAQMTAQNTFEVKPGQKFTITETANQSPDTAYLQQRIERFDGSSWVPLGENEPIVAGAPGTTTMYRIVNAEPPLVDLPFTGGIGVDRVWFAGGLVLGAGLIALIVRERRRRTTSATANTQ